MSRENVLSTKLDITIAVVAVAGALYHLVATQYLFFGSLLHQNYHLLFSAVLTFLVSMKKIKGRQMDRVGPICRFGRFETS